MMLVQILRRNLRRFWRAIALWGQLDGNLMAAAVSFYASLATFPLIMVLMALLGFFVRFTGKGQNIQAGILHYVSNQSSEQLAAQLGRLLEQVQVSSFVGGPLGLLFLLMLSVAVFSNFERAFARIWMTPAESSGFLAGLRRILFYRLRAFLMLLGVALIIVLNFFSNFAIELAAKFTSDLKIAHGWWQLAHLGASIMLNAVMFTVIYQTLPKVRVPWLSALQGGLLAAVTWEIGRSILATLLISDKYDAFGVVGGFMGLLMWAFYGSAVILFGGIYVRVVCEDKRVFKGNDHSR